ncbi:OsmC family protein [Nocardioides solisilvae]|uniref:OsmC family protein n=1 Tax=Nocardioides solisilvae TaxID=1542435 RepID=UPI000D7415AA|nr:OsmC family protein [Nocardioides solisilvae]
MAEAAVQPEPYAVRVGAGSLRLAEGLDLAHAWTSDGIVTDAVGTGAHLLHLSVGVCVLNDCYREAARLGVALDGVLVTVEGGFDEEWRPTGLRYAVEVEGPDPALVEALIEAVDEVAEIPRALRAGGTVRRVAAP